MVIGSDFDWPIELACRTASLVRSGVFVQLSHLIAALLLSGVKRRIGRFDPRPQTGEFGLSWGQADAACQTELRVMRQPQGLQLAADTLGNGGSVACAQVAT